MFSWTKLFNIKQRIYCIGLIVLCFASYLIYSSHNCQCCFVASRASSSGRLNSFLLSTPPSSVWNWNKINFDSIRFSIGMFKRPACDICGCEESAHEMGQTERHKQCTVTLFGLLTPHQQAQVSIPLREDNMAISLLNLCTLLHISVPIQNVLLVFPSMLSQNLLYPYFCTGWPASQTLCSVISLLS